MIELGRMLGDHFDGVILYEDRYVRGRAEGEIMRLMRQGVAEGKRVRRGRRNSRLDRRRRAGAGDRAAGRTAAAASGRDRRDGRLSQGYLAANPKCSR